MKSVQSDRLILVDAKKLIDLADTEDLACRDSDVIADLYHPDWFIEYQGREYFIPPAVYITQGAIRFINGRHRFLLLSRHLNSFPLAIGNLDMDHDGGAATTKSIDVLTEITLNQFTEHAVFNDMPELPFGNFALA